MDYITIIQGDDTNFLGDQFVVVNFNTSIDLSGFTATFTLGDVTLTYGNLSGKTFEIILSSEITSNLKIGKQYGDLKLIDNNDRIRTVSSVIPFIVKKGVDETITFVNSSLTVSMNINDTVIDIYVETSGISRSEANRILDACNEAKQAAQNYSNTAQNTFIELNETITNFNNNVVDTTELIDEAKEQADIAIEQAEHVTEVLEASAKKDFSNLDAEALDKMNQSKALTTGNISSDADIYNQILGYKQNNAGSGIDIISQNYTLQGTNLTVENGITNGLGGVDCGVWVVGTLPTTQEEFNIHIECIIREDYSDGASYLFATKESGLMIQMEYHGGAMFYLYGSDGNTQMLQVPALTLQTGDRLVVDAGFNLIDGIYMKTSCNGVSESRNSTSILGTSIWLRTIIKTFLFGCNTWSYSCHVEIDLSSSYVETSAGKIRPLFQIPYILSKTGSKIVDAIYRDRVQEVYAKEGSANYFTLDETNENFSLPMGEIYGLINKNSLSEVTNVSQSFKDMVLDWIAPNHSAKIELLSIPLSSSPYTTPSAGWYVFAAQCADIVDIDLYINGAKSGIVMPGYTSASESQEVIVYLAKGDSIYWSNSMTGVVANAFIPAKGSAVVAGNNEEHEWNEGNEGADLDDVLS